MGFAAGVDDDATARLLSRPNVEEQGADLLEAFYAHLAVLGDAFPEAGTLDGEVGVIDRL